MSRDQEHDRRHPEREEDRAARSRGGSRSRASAPCRPRASAAGGTTEGAISRIEAAAVARNATKKTSRWSSVTCVQPFANGTASRNAKQHLHPGQRDPELVQELDQLSVEIVLGACARSPEEVAVGRHHELAARCRRPGVDSTDRRRRAPRRSSPSRAPLHLRARRRRRSPSRAARSRRGRARPSGRAAAGSRRRRSRRRSCPGARRGRRSR